MRAKRKVQTFNQAPVGTPALEVCAACGQETGVILLKSRGFSGEDIEYDGPRHVATPDSRCEFCEFLGMWMAHEKIESGTVKVGAAKIVEEVK